MFGYRLVNSSLNARIACACVLDAPHTPQNSSLMFWAAAPNDTASMSAAIIDAVSMTRRLYIFNDTSRSYQYASAAPLDCGAAKLPAAGIQCVGSFLCKNMSKAFGHACLPNQILLTRGQSCTHVLSTIRF